MDLLSILTKIIKVVSVVYHFVANFLPFKNTFLIILPRRRHVGHARQWHLKG